MSITLPQNYRPTDREPFMNTLQQEYFRQKLLKWRGELIEESNQTLQNMQEESLAQPDLADRATAETDRSLELRTRDRFRKLISKIESALKSIEEGTYGYCEETGEPIALKRLEARPIATLSVEAQERHERLERTRRRPTALQEAVTTTIALGSIGLGILVALACANLGAVGGTFATIVAWLCIAAINVMYARSR